MKVSMKGDYGVRGLIELAHHYGEGPVQSAVIASRQGVPEPYLDQLLTALRRAGFIRSVRGPQGGPLPPTACLDAPNGCRKSTSCSLRPVWQEVEAATIRILDSITIADLAERERAGSVARYAI